MATGALFKAICTTTGDPVSKLVLISLASQTKAILGNWVYRGSRFDLVSQCEIDLDQAARALAMLSTLGLATHLDGEPDGEAWVCFPRPDVDLPTLRQWWRSPAKKTKPTPIPSAIRLAVYQRDGFRCIDCRWAPTVPEGYDGRYALSEKPAVGGTIFLTMDHRTPRAAGGPTTIDNLDTRCSPCNSSKGARV